jgi:sulfite reductase (ferredoxin)
VVIDLVATLLFEAEEKLAWGADALAVGQYSDGIYHAYSTFVQGAKALLLGEGVSCNTQHGIINDFDKHFVATGKINIEGGFKALVMQINEHEPAESFAKQYYQQAADFYKDAQAYREAAATAAVPVNA